MYVTLVSRTKGTRLAKPTVSLTLLCLAMLVGVVRVAEYRNHWSDVLAGFFTGAAIAIFLVRRLPLFAGHCTVKQRWVCAGRGEDLSGS